MFAAIEEFITEAWFLIPLGVIGVWRWLTWMLKRLLAAFYRPIRTGFRGDVTVISAVFDEDPELFGRAVASWRAAGAKAIIVVVQGPDQRCATVAANIPDVRVISLPTPSKRHAMMAGIAECETPLVVFADSDVIWAKDVLEHLVQPFADPTIGGVGTRQNVLTTDSSTVWERVADIFLDVRYYDEVPATSQWGRAISCLSGRTAAYRTDLVKRFRHEFLNETFWGVPCVSGDDKRLTTLVLKDGFFTVTQLEARVYSAFQRTFSGFVRQRVRWARNTYRSDLRALSERWAWRHPLLVFVMIDKAVGPFAQLLGLSVFAWAAWSGVWEVIVIQVVWWHFSRAIKIYPHLVRNPRALSLLTLFAATSLLGAFIKLYALLTIRQQAWLTRSTHLHPTPAALAESGRAGSM